MKGFVRVSRWWWALIFCILATGSWAVDVVVEGSAPVRDGDLGAARELATRRALARAAESQGATVNSQILVRQGVALESAQVRASACTSDSHVIGESVRDGELTVTLRVTVSTTDSCSSSCQRGHVNKIVVAGFALEFPQQLLVSEKSWLANHTAVELARMIRKHQRLLADADGTSFPYVSPTRAPEPFLRKSDVETPFAALARAHRGQYVLSGVYRDFGLRGKPWGAKSRRIEIEAFLHDGANGALLAKRSFTREATGEVILSDTPTIGSSEFYAGDFGRVWGVQLDDIAQWAEEKVACLPFIARVVKTDGSLIYIDAGAESGLSAGDTMNLHVWRESGVRGVTELVLGQEKNVRASGSVKSVYPRFSIVQLIEAPKVLEIRIGDLLYSK